MSRGRGIRRGLAWVGAGLLAGLLLLALRYTAPVLSDPEPGFLPRKGELQTVRITRTWQRDDTHFAELLLSASSGLQVEISVRRLLSVSGRQPVVILLGGYRTGRGASGLLPGQPPAVIVALSYPYAGDRLLSGSALLWNLPSVQQALYDITPAILLTVDYLLQQPYADPAQVELVGVSLGAFLVPIAGAIDERIQRVWLIQGAGDPPGLYAERLRDRITNAWWRETLAAGLGFLTNTHHLSPEYWVGRIAPRPVVVINSRHDPAFPPRNVQVLHAALREPYEIIWLEEGGHVRPDEQRIIRLLSETVLQRIAPARP